MLLYLHIVNKGLLLINGIIFNDGSSLLRFYHISKHHNWLTGINFEIKLDLKKQNQ
jgi:hypothetical protein